MSRHLRTILELKAIEKNGGSIGKEFDSYALKHPDKPAFLFKDEVWTFREVLKLNMIIIINKLGIRMFSIVDIYFIVMKVYEKSNRIGNLFSQNGLRKMDRVSIFMENRPEYICTWLGLCKVSTVIFI